MAIIGSDGLSLSFGDGGAPETFTPLVGLRLTRFELTQKNHVATAIGSTAWNASQGVSTRRAGFDGEALADDGVAAHRLRSLALNGGAGNFTLELSSAETLSGAGVVTQYREVIAAGAITLLQFRIEASGAVTIA